MKLETIGNTKLCKELVKYLLDDIEYKTNNDLYTEKPEYNSQLVLEQIDFLRKMLNPLQELDKEHKEYFAKFLIQDVYDKLNNTISRSPYKSKITDKFWEVITEYVKFKLDHNSDPMDVDIMHPIQPLYLDKYNVLRFKENKIVSDLLNFGGYDLNALSCKRFSNEDWEQFNQLHGYSLSGFSDIPQSTDRVYYAAKNSFDKNNIVTTNPDQPIIDGKYKENKIVVFLFAANSNGKVDIKSSMYSNDDKKQLYQLIGCSVDSEVFKGLT